MALEPSLTAARKSMARLVNADFRPSEGAPRHELPSTNGRMMTAAAVAPIANVLADSRRHRSRTTSVNVVARIVGQIDVTAARGLLEKDLEVAGAIRNVGDGFSIRRERGFAFKPGIDGQRS